MLCDRVQLVQQHLCRCLPPATQSQTWFKRMQMLSHRLGTRDHHIFVNAAPLCLADWAFQSHNQKRIVKWLSTFWRVQRGLTEGQTASHNTKANSTDILVSLSLFNDHITPSCIHENWTIYLWSSLSCASGCVVECRTCNREVAGSNLGPARATSHQGLLSLLSLQGR